MFFSTLTATQVRQLPMQGMLSGEFSSLRELETTVTIALQVTC